MGSSNGQEPQGCQNEVIEPLRLERTFKIESSYIGEEQGGGSLMA